jgi:LmbE family N-acetylglucosaminyl deacetylase
MLWEQIRDGQEVQVWTICAGSPPGGQPLSEFAQSLHARWETGAQAAKVRREEDQQALKRLGASPKYWTLPDCIYRRLPDGPNGAPGSWLVNGEDDLWRQVHPLEAPLVERLAAWLQRLLIPDDRLVSPLTLGNHVDHFLTRAAAQIAAPKSGCELAYYPDYPYAVKPGADLAAKVEPGWRKECRDISLPALRAWQDATACYTSQINTFWDGRDGLDAALESYWQSGGGSCLWQRR